MRALEKQSVDPDPSEGSRAPVTGPLIQTISIALLSVVPGVAGAAAVIWAVAGLLGLSSRVWIGADVVVGMALVALSVPILVGIYRNEQASALTERMTRVMGPAITVGPSDKR
jgi:hypothetical protein